MTHLLRQFGNIESNLPLTVTIKINFAFKK